ncbi:MAG TPA: nucleoside-diphosphate kinase, partial [Patescibacteria group bacterium]
KSMSNIKQERTFIMIKPDGVKRGLTGEILRRIEQVNLKLIALGMFQATEEQIDNHYPKDEKWINRLGEKTMKTYQKYGFDAKSELGTDDTLEIGQMVRGWLITYMTSAPVVKMVVEGIHAVDMVRKLAGDTIPAFADCGTIRGDFSVDSAASANRDKRAIHNLVHASETPEEAGHEIGYWFAPEDINSYKRVEDDLML